MNRVARDLTVVAATLLFTSLPTGGADGPGDLARPDGRYVQGQFRGRAALHADGRLLVLSDEGTLALVQATPEAYREDARARVLDGKSWTLSTLANGKLYLRDLKQPVALDISG